MRVLEELGLDFLPLVALAKREEEVYHPASLHPLTLDLASPALHALRRIRDEAHRFAVSYHTKLRAKRTLTSVLDQIPGIGPTLRTNLLRHLGSAKRVRAASVAELAAVPKITPKLAQRIHGFFHPGPDPDRAPE
jgi:excinuclease ABC subunit C